MSCLLDAVGKAELSTRFDSDRTVHVCHSTDVTTTERSCLREEHWKQDGGLIGSGSFGSVWIEQCVRGPALGQWRAVKRVVKSSQPLQATKVDYHRELEAIVRFSQSEYERCFVKSFGWYQNDSSIFIAMEYLEYGNLQHHLDQHPALGERDAQNVCFQILNALNFMHENAYSHRDIKPANILIKSKPPEAWWIKLGDFGFSKCASDNHSTIAMIRQGTLPYMAPELLDYIDVDKTLLLRDTRAADIWAVGEIVFQMLTKQPAFRNPNELITYISQPKSFPSVFLRFKDVSVPAIAFIERLMRPRPEKRPTAAQAMLHTWLETAHITEVARSTEAGLEQRTSDERLIMAPPLSLSHNRSSIPAASAQWSAVSMAVPPPGGNNQNLELQGSGLSVENSVPGVRSISESNSIADTVTINYAGARYFILKSHNTTNIASSLARGVWSSNKANNTRLTNAYHATHGNVFLIFSVNKSRKFCGVAAMRSRWKSEMTNPHWRDGVWEGGFLVEWLSQTPVSFDDVSHLKHSANGMPITRTRFMTELCAVTGHQLMQKFGLFDNTNIPVPDKSPPQSSISSLTTVEPAPAPRTQLELEVLFCRHKLQQGLLSRQSPPDKQAVPQMSNYIRHLENLNPTDLQSSILQTTKILKVLRLISKSHTIPTETENEFHLKTRSLNLLHKWNKILPNESTGHKSPA